jgi:hypothetical protein
MSFKLSGKFSFLLLLPVSLFVWFPLDYPKSLPYFVYIILLFHFCATWFLDTSFHTRCRENLDSHLHFPRFFCCVYVCVSFLLNSSSLCFTTKVMIGMEVIRSVRLDINGTWVSPVIDWLCHVVSRSSTVFILVTKWRSFWLWKYVIIISHHCYLFYITSFPPIVFKIVSGPTVTLESNWNLKLYLQNL